MPGPFGYARDDRHHEHRRQHLERRRRQRRRVDEMTPRDQGRDAIAERAGEAQPDAKPLPAGKTEIFAMQDDDADQSGNHAGNAPRGEFFLAGRSHDRDGKQRRRRIEDRGEPARDIGLPGDDQRERQHIVEQRHREEWLPA